MQRDQWWRIVSSQETGDEANEGLAKFFGPILSIVMAIAIVDHGLTVAWRWSISMWDWLAAQLPI